MNKFKCSRCGKLIVESDMKFPDGIGLVHYIGYVTPSIFEHIKCGGEFKQVVEDG